MCRLFGFRSVIQSGVHRSLVAADNALADQSGQHPDGWGVAYYVDGAPHVTRSPTTALSDQLFHRLSGVVTSETVLAHVRKATQGNNSVLNCHPFQYGRWVFAHNGDIKEFDSYRDRLKELIAPRLRGYVLGDTDSEVLFFVFLSHLSGFGPLSRRHSVEDVMAALRMTVLDARKVCDPTAPEPSLLTMMVTDGETLAATQGGKELFYTTYKTRCSDRDSCASLSPECEAPTESGFVNHLILSSEPLQGENIWIELDRGAVIGVDWRMRLVHAQIDQRPLHVVQGPPPAKAS